MIREISLFEADLGENMWDFAQEIEGVTVGFIEENPSTVQRNERVVGDFASSTNNILANVTAFFREAVNFGHQ